MNCAACGSESRTLETRKQAGGAIIQRRRICIGCGARWVTHEARIERRDESAAHGDQLRRALAETLAEIKGLASAIGAERTTAIRNGEGIAAALEKADGRLADLAIEVESAWWGQA